MMKQLVYSLIFLGCFNVCKAQDLIVTVAGDSLNCKITQIQKEYIFFFYEQDNETIRSSVPTSKVIYYEKDYYVMPGVFSEKMEKELPANINRGMFRLGFYGGFSYMTGTIPANFGPVYQDHLKRLKNGGHIGGDFSIFLSKYLSLGAKYSLFITQDKVSNVIFEDPFGGIFLGEISERVFVHYFAPKIFLKAGRNEGKIFFVFDGSIGCLVYRNSGVLVQDDFSMKGTTIGMSLVPGIEFKVSPIFFINLNLGLTVGVMNRATMISAGQTVTLNDIKENISRMDISLAFRWYQRVR